MPMAAIKTQLSLINCRGSVVKLTTIGSVVSMYVFMTVVCSAQANNNAHNMHAGVTMSPPVA